MKITNFVVEHNLPLAVSDHLTPLVHDVFSDSQIAKKVAGRRSKANTILNQAVAPQFHSESSCVVWVHTISYELHFVFTDTLIENMRNGPYISVLMDLMTPEWKG